MVGDAVYRDGILDFWTHWFNGSRVWKSCEYGMNIVCHHAACFRLSVRDVGRSDEHAGSVAELVVSFGRPNETMRNTDRMIRELFATFPVQFKTQSRNTVLSKMSYLLFISWRRIRCFEHYTFCTSYCLWKSQNLSKYVITCQSNLPFCVDREKGNLTVACHRHPTD